MTSQYLLVIFLVYSVTVVHITGEECKPSYVGTLSVSEDSFLEWSPPYNSDCEISHYLVEIRSQPDTEIVREITGTELSLRDLPVCKMYEFTVAAVSADGTDGAIRQLFAKLPLPIGADLSIILFGAARLERGVLLEWEVRDEWKNCIDQYRLSIYDDDSNNDPPTSVYVNYHGVTLNNLTPCTTYTFGLRAIYDLENEGPYASTTYLVPADKIAAPILENFTPGTTTIDLIWQLESFERNRCPISSLTVDASPYFKITYPVSHQIDRSSVPIHLVGLEPDTLYMLNVTVANSAGTSTPALIAVQTLESY